MDSMRKPLDSDFLRGLVNEVGIRVRTARIRAGLTQKELGELIGYSTSGVAKVERGNSEPRLSALAQIAAVTGVPFTLLLPIAIPQQVETIPEFSEHMRRYSELGIAEWIKKGAEALTPDFISFVNPKVVPIADPTIVPFAGLPVSSRLPKRIRHRRKPQ